MNRENTGRKKGRAPSHDPPGLKGHAPWKPGSFLLWECYQDIKGILKKQTNLEITFQKSREIYKPTLPTHPQRKQNQLPSKMLKIKPNQYLHGTFSTPSSPMSRGFHRDSDKRPCTVASKN